MTPTQDSDSKMTQDDKIIKFGSKCCASCKNEYNINTVTMSDFYSSIPKKLNAWGFYSSDEVSRVQRYMYMNYWKYITKTMTPPCKLCSLVYKKEYNKQHNKFLEWKDELDERHREFCEFIRYDCGGSY